MPEDKREEGVDDYVPLPGYKVYEHKNDHARTQRFTFSGNQAVELTRDDFQRRSQLVSLNKNTGDPINREDETSPRRKKAMPAHEPMERSRDQWATIGPAGLGRDVPKFVAYANNILGFSAWVVPHGSSLEDIAYKKPKAERESYAIMYYLDNDTLSVRSEKRGDGGLIVQRAKIATIPEVRAITTIGDNQVYDYITWKHLSIGRSTLINSNTYLPYACDQFTREWYNKQGITQPMDLTECALPPLTTGALEHTKDRDEALSNVITVELHRKCPVNENMRNFMELDGKICRFYALAKDEYQGVIEQRHFALLFFLADETAEILEVYKPDSGCSRPPRYSRRQQMVVERDNNQEPLKLDAFDVGISLRLLQKEFFIYDADAFTRMYFSERLGHELGPKIDYTAAPEWQGATIGALNTIGQHGPRPLDGGHARVGGDHAEGVESTVQAEHWEMTQFGQKRMKENVLLRFCANLTNEGEADRDFMIYVGTVDDTITVYEPPGNTNAPLVGTRVLQRNKYMGPNGEFYRCSDFRVGKKMIINNAEYIITAQDETQRKFVEERGESAKSSVIHLQSLTKAFDQLKLSLIRKGWQAGMLFRDVDHDKNGLITIDEIELFLQSAEVHLNERELTLFLYLLNTSHDGAVSFPEFCHAVQQNVLFLPCITDPESLASSHELDAYVRLEKARRIALKHGEATLLAVKRLQQVSQQTKQFSTRFVKELGCRTRDEPITPINVHASILRLGHEITLPEIELSLEYFQKRQPSQPLTVQTLSQVFTHTHNQK